MKEVTIENGYDILHMELIDVLALLTVETLDNGYDCGEMVIPKLNTNHGSFNYSICCEMVKEDSAFTKFKRLFKR